MKETRGHKDLIISSKETRGHKDFCQRDSGPQGFQNRPKATRTSKETRGHKDFKIDSGPQGVQKRLGATRILIKKSLIFSIPAAPGQPGQSKSLLFKRNFTENRHFSLSRPLPASPGNENRYFSKRILLKIDTFLHPGRSRPARAIKIVALYKEFE